MEYDQGGELTFLYIVHGCPNMDQLGSRREDSGLSSLNGKCGMQSFCLIISCSQQAIIAMNMQHVGWISMQALTLHVLCRHTGEL